MLVRFPDGSNRTPTDCRTTYRLLAFSPRVWVGEVFTATAMHWREKPMIGVSRDNRAVAYLEHMGEGKGYAGGAWPDGTTTAFTARKDGDALILELWDVEATAPGPWHLPGVDGA